MTRRSLIRQHLLRATVQFVLMILIMFLTGAAIIASAAGLASLIQPGPLWETVIYGTAIGLYIFALIQVIPATNALSDRFFTQTPPAFIITVTDAAITRTSLARPTASLCWHELQEVHIINEDGWPIGTQSWVLIARNGHVLSLPSDAQGMDELLHQMQQRLGGFDNEAVINAMGNIDGTFIIWKDKSL